MRGLARVAALAALLSAACAPRPTAAELTVFAAASLGEAFDDLANTYEADNPGVHVTVNLAGTQTLRSQLEQGARADVFASANPDHMRALVDEGLVAETEVRPFATNELVVIVPPDNPGGVGGLPDLARPGLRVLLAAPEVPAGSYARAVLASLSGDAALGAGYAQAVLANMISEESNVRQVVTKVRLGEADAGIVYASDVTPDTMRALNTIPIPPEYNVTAQYVIAPLAEAPSPILAQSFVDHVLSAEGRSILAHWGFGAATE